MSLIKQFLWMMLENVALVSPQGTFCEMAGSLWNQKKDFY